jgi:hypothetical protein
MAKLTPDQVAYLNRLSPSTDANLGDIVLELQEAVFGKEEVKKEAPVAEKVEEPKKEAPAEEEE